MSDHLERHLNSRLASTQTATDGHPDAAALNAFRERRLSSSSRDTVARHLCACPACREILALSALTTAALGANKRHSLFRFVAAAAALTLVFAGSASRIENEIVMPGLAVQKLTPPLPDYFGRRSPVLAYASAELRDSAAAFRWRVRQQQSSTMLEQSSDGGLTWTAAKLDSHFEPKAVGFKGADVWVTGRSGNMLLSRDAGRHWHHFQPDKTR